MCLCLRIRYICLRLCIWGVAFAFVRSGRVRYMYRVPTHNIRPTAEVGKWLAGYVKNKKVQEDIISWNLPAVEEVKEEADAGILEEVKAVCEVAQVRLPFSPPHPHSRFCALPLYRTSLLFLTKLCAGCGEQNAVTLVQALGQFGGMLSTVAKMLHFPPFSSALGALGAAPSPSLCIARCAWRRVPHCRLPHTIVRLALSCVCVCVSCVE